MKVPKQHITLAQVKVACRKAYQEKRLLAQNPLAHATQEYGYRVNGYVCAIGAALSEQTLALLTHNSPLQGTSVCTNMVDFLPFSWPQGETSALREIQSLHDHWLFEVSSKCRRQIGPLPQELSFVRAISV